MDEKPGREKKPLRTATNKIKDLFDAYGKAENARNIPIADKEAGKDKAEIENKRDDAIKPEERTAELKETQEAPFVDNGKIAELEEKIQTIEREKEELADRLVRKAAELENVRRRSIKEKNDMLEYANERLLFNLLPINDDIGKALESSKKNKDFDALATGVEMIRKNLVKLFEEHSVKEMEDPVGKPFDVDYHEALMQTPSELPADAIAQVVVPGYMIKDKVLRHAKVITSSGEPPEEK